ncbi:MAG: hypothetical protein EFT35_03015 [Methanophagales archaeon ANME-1-THS]|nr:MAG: hypothetical protein EFT35_03015 [Methanophagales archaeon ANME-1-THS]
MNKGDKKEDHKKEKEHYEAIKTKLEELLKRKFVNFHLEITADKRFSNRLKAEINPNRNIIFHFLKEAAPDITGFIKEKYSSDFIVVEIKAETIKLDDIYQTRKYAELFHAKYALLISTQEIPEEIKRLAKVNYSLLSSGYDYAKINLVHFDTEKEKFSEWFEKNPFEG